MGLLIGDPRLAARIIRCCGKPRGCTMTHAGCVYLRHPWKRAVVFGDTTVRCQATCVRDGVERQCALRHGHAGPCVV